MALFDAISDFIKPIGEFIGDAGDLASDVIDSPLGRLGKAYVEGSGIVGRNARTRAEQARRLQREDLMPVGTNVQAGEARWGLQQYASDPSATERYWQSVLTQFMTPNATGGKR